MNKNYPRSSMSCYRKNRSNTENEDSSRYRSLNRFCDDVTMPRRSRPIYSRSRQPLKRKLPCSSAREFSRDDNYRQLKIFHADGRHQLKRICSRAGSFSSEDSSGHRKCQSPKTRRTSKRKAACSGARDRSFSSDDNNSHRYSNHRYGTYDVPVKRPRERCRLESKPCLFKEFKIMKYFFEKSKDLLAEGSLNEALEAINVAIGLCKEDKYLSKFYEKRGTIYSYLEEPKCSLNGFLDWEHAFMLNNNNIKARKKMSKVLFMGANKYYRLKKYHKAEKPCNFALWLNEKNGEAYVLKKIIERKLSTKKLRRTQDVSNSASCASASIMRNNAINMKITRKVAAEAEATTNYA